MAGGKTGCAKRTNPSILDWASPAPRSLFPHHLPFTSRQAAALPEAPLSDLITVGCSFFGAIFHRAIRRMDAASCSALRRPGWRPTASSPTAPTWRPLSRLGPRARGHPAAGSDRARHGTGQRPCAQDPGGHQASPTRRDAAAAEGRHHHRGRRGDRLAAAYGPWRARRRVEGVARARGDLGEDRRRRPGVPHRVVRFRQAVGRWSRTARA